MFATEKIPLFPLGIVLMPNLAMPLHIFEKRYKEMINWCLEKHEVFGVAYYDDKKIAPVGCTARILKVLKQYKDGKMDIIVQGQDRFEIERVVQEKSYNEAYVDYFDDVYEPDALRLEALADDLRKLFKRMFKISGRTLDAKSIESVDLKTLSFLAAFHEVMSLGDKQKFLENRYLEERLKQGIEVMKKMIETTKANRKVQEIIQSNGHLPGSFGKKGKDG